MYLTRQKSKLIEFENNLNNKQITKDSFERFGDDLTELVLSFLTINNKLKYETVCKQWKSLIFNKQEYLEFDFIWNHSKEDIFQRVFYCSSRSHNVRPELQLKPKLFESILNKFKFVNHLYFGCYRFTIINDSILDIITNNCKYLSIMSIESGGIDHCSDQAIERFAQKLGPKLKAIYLSEDEYYNREKLKIIYDLSPNIEVFYFYEYLRFISVFTSKSNNYYSKLKDITFHYNQIPVNEFIQFTDIYCKQIKKIDIESAYGESEEIFDKRLFKQLSRFENIKVLKLKFSDNKLSVNDMMNGLIMIGNECKHLVELLLDLRTGKESNMIAMNRSIFQILTAFQTLIECDFSLSHREDDGDDDDDDILPNPIYISNINIEGLNCMRNMNHLKLDIIHLNDNHFEHLDQFMPNLKSLEITAVLYYSITDKSLHTFAKMQNLTDVSLSKWVYNDEENSKPFEITDDGVIELIKNCKRIESIHIQDKRCRITDRTIDAVMGVKLRPKFNYSFYFHDNIGGELKEYVECVQNSLSDNIRISSYVGEF